jgi:hypothetical protein
MTDLPTGHSASITAHFFDFDTPITDVTDEWRIRGLALPA